MAPAPFAETKLGRLVEVTDSFISRGPFGSGASTCTYPHRLRASFVDYSTAVDAFIARLLGDIIGEYNLFHPLPFLLLVGVFPRRTVRSSIAGLVHRLRRARYRYQQGPAVHAVSAQP
jgi:hypothetical protein